MKIKNVLFFGLILSSINSYSQSDSISRFPDSKNLMLELNFNPFGDDGIFSFDNLQTKYWINKKIALRLGSQFDYKNNSMKEDEYKSDEVYKPTVLEKSFLIGFKPGIEFRILEKSKISPYWGIELSFLNKSSKSEYIDYNREYDYVINDYVYNRVETKLKGAWRKVTFQELETMDPWGGTSYKMYRSTDYTYERAFSSYGLNLLLGTDFFLIRYLYFGFEIGLGYKMTKFKQIELELINYTNPQSPFYPCINGNVTYPSSKSTDFGFYYNNSIRLGVYF